MDLFDVRNNYTKGHLSPEDLQEEPIEQVELWVKEAEEAKCLEHSSIVLSTISLEGGVSSRVVLLKKIDGDGFYFFTNYDSRKGQQIAANGKGAIMFFWPELERQVNIEGTIEKCSEQSSNEYFDRRPLASRVSAVVSKQSQAVASREEMTKQWQSELARAENEGILRPDYWGGYILKPTRIEFWQGGSDRFHDRIVFQKTQENWLVERLMP